MPVSLTTTIKGLPELLAAMKDAPLAIRRATSRTLNETVHKSVGIMSAQASKTYRITQRDIRSTFTEHTANPNDLRAWAKTSSHKFNLVQFGVTNRRSDYVTIQELRSRRTRVPHGFMAIVGSGHLGIFQRKGRGRFPIVELVGLSPAQMVSSPRHWPAVEHDLSDFFRKRLIANAKFYLSRK